LRYTYFLLTHDNQMCDTTEYLRYDFTNLGIAILDRKILRY